MPKTEHKAQQTVLQQIREASQGEDVPGNQTLTQTREDETSWGGRSDSLSYKELMKKREPCKGERMQGELKGAAWDVWLVRPGWAFGPADRLHLPGGLCQGLSAPGGTLGGSRPPS